MRRTLVALAAGMVTLAGCAGMGGDESRDLQTPSPTTSETPVEEASPEPTVERLSYTEQGQVTDSRDPERAHELWSHFEAAGLGDYDERQEKYNDARVAISLADEDGAFEGFPLKEEGIEYRVAVAVAPLCINHAEGHDIQDRDLEASMDRMQSATSERYSWDDRKQLLNIGVDAMCESDWLSTRATFISRF